MYTCLISIVGSRSTVLVSVRAALSDNYQLAQVLATVLVSTLLKLYCSVVVIIEVTGIFKDSANEIYNCQWARKVPVNSSSW